MVVTGGRWEKDLGGGLPLKGHVSVTQVLELLPLPPRL